MLFCYYEIGFFAKVNIKSISNNTIQKTTCGASVEHMYSCPVSGFSGERVNFTPSRRRRCDNRGHSKGRREFSLKSKSKEIVGNVLEYFKSEKGKVCKA